MSLLHDLVKQFNDQMGEFCSPAVIKARDTALKKKQESQRAAFTEKVKAVYGTLQKSELFCDFYYPD